MDLDQLKQAFSLEIELTDFHIYMQKALFRAVESCDYEVINDLLSEDFNFNIRDDVRIKTKLFPLLLVFENMRPSPSRSTGRHRSQLLSTRAESVFAKS